MEKPPKPAAAPAKRGRVRGQGKAGARQKASGWYAAEKGMITRHWWKDPGVFEAMAEKRENRSRKVVAPSQEKAKDSDPPSPKKVPPNLDVHAAFFWECLRRDPQSRRLRKLWRKLIEADAKNKSGENSRMSQFRQEQGFQMALALDDFCAYWELDYYSLLSKDNVPGGWLGGYHCLWNQVCRKTSPPLPIPWRFEGASSRVLHGTACVDLVVENSRGKAIGMEEALSPFRGRYTSEITTDFGLSAFARAVDAAGEPLEDLSINDLLNLPEFNSPVLPPEQGAANPEARLINLDQASVSHFSDEVRLEIRWDLLVDRLKDFGLIPMLVAINPSAPDKLLASEFTSMVRQKCSAGTKTAKKPSENSFEKIRILDLEVLEGVPLESTVTGFAESSGLDIPRLARILAKFASR